METCGKSKLKFFTSCALIVWMGIVLLRFFQEHPLSFETVWKLILDFKVPVPSDFLKILLILKHVLLACLLTCVGIITGRRILRMVGVWPPNQQQAETWNIVLNVLLSLGLGWGILIYAVFVLGVVGGLYTIAIWGLFALLLVICHREIPPLWADIRAMISPNVSEKSSLIEKTASAFIAAMLLLLAIAALSPNIAHDSMVYHLNVPRVYVGEHGIVPIPYNLFSNTTLNIEMLYTAALLIDDFVLANLIHYIFGASALMFLYAFARRYFDRATALLAALIFFLNPPTLGEAPIAYVDLSMGFYFLLCVYCFWQWRTSSDTRWFMLLAVFAGIFAGIKYTSLHGLVSICVAVVAVEFFSSEAKLGRVAVRLALLGGVVSLFVAPYLIKNAVITGNPVYPLMYNIFDGRWLTPIQVERMLAYVDNHGMGHSALNLIMLPWNVTVYGKTGYANFDATITPVWLMIIPLFFFLKQKPALLRWLAFICVVYFVSWAASTHITRYLTPIYPLLSLICAYTAVTARRNLRNYSPMIGNVFATVLVLVFGVLWFSFAYKYPLRIPGEFGPVLWGEQTTDEFLARRVPGYQAFKFINEHLPPDARLAFMWDNRGFFCERPQIGDSVFEAPSMIELVHEAGAPDVFRETLRQMGVTHILYNTPFHDKFNIYTISKEDKARVAADGEILREFVVRYCMPLYWIDDVAVYSLRE